MIFNYNISCGRQHVALCARCAREWHRAFHATEAALSLCIEAINNPAGQRHAETG